MHTLHIPGTCLTDLRNAGQMKTAFSSVVKHGLRRGLWLLNTGHWGGAQAASSPPSRAISPGTHMKGLLPLLPLVWTSRSLEGNPVGPNKVTGPSTIVLPVVCKCAHTVTNSSGKQEETCPAPVVPLAGVEGLAELLKSEVNGGWRCLWKEQFQPRILLCELLSGPVAFP